VTDLRRSADGQWFSLAFQMRCDPKNIKMKEFDRERGYRRVGGATAHCIPVLSARPCGEGDKLALSAEANKGSIRRRPPTHRLAVVAAGGASPFSPLIARRQRPDRWAPDDTASRLGMRAGSFEEIFNASVLWPRENDTNYGDHGGSSRTTAIAILRIKPPPPNRRQTVPVRESRNSAWQDLG